MIANDRQYQHTRKQVLEMEATLVALAGGMAGDDGFRDLQTDAVRGVLEDMRTEMAEYDDLRSGSSSVIEASSLSGLAEALIQARIARGWTQADLAVALGVAEQQVQRYEASRYSGASLARLCDVAHALNVSVTETLVLLAS